MTKAGMFLDKLKVAVPELFELHPVAATKTFIVRQPNDPLYDSSKQFEKDLSLIPSIGIEDVPWNEVLLIPGRLMWEHNGKCDCGRRVFLFSQCKQCLDCLLYTSPSPRD